jgi:threonine synthase
MQYVLGLECLECYAEYAVDREAQTCRRCGGNLDVVYDYAAIRRAFTPQSLASNRDSTIRRWLPLLPIVDSASLPALEIGGTPLYPAQRLGEQLGLARLYIKDDGRNPTASFKDRASAVVVAVAREHGAAVITTASSGNAGAALAGCAAAAGMRSVVFVPHTAPKAKVAQLLLFGARVFAVRGTYDQAFDLCLEASRLYGWYNRNTGYNPYTREGKKTCSLEIAEQLGRSAGRRFSVPDKVFVAVGDGNIISGLWKGFRDLLALGWIAHLPQLIGVQAAGSAPLVTAWETHRPVQAVDAHTIADSICVGLPRDGAAALRAVRETGGRFVSVTDEAILEAMRLLPKASAVTAEPAGATGFAGLVKLVGEGLVRADEQVVVVVTGSGLKDVDSSVLAGGRPETIEPSVEGIKSAMAGS